MMTDLQVGAASAAIFSRSTHQSRLKPLLQAFIAVLLLCPMLQVHAHEIRPGLLDIKERDSGWFDVTWKVPVRGEQILPVLPILPDSLELLGTPTVKDIPGARIERATYKSNGAPLTGKTIIIDGLSALQTDVLLAIEFNDGVRHSAILRPGSPKFTIPLKASKWEVAVSYWHMGVVHILEGIDHLLFVLALLLIVSGFKPLLLAVTAFTVAHSITLALATLGMVHVPPKPTEAIIALSIVFLATEIVHKRNGHVGLTERYPWMIAFIFGLFHGLGFAGALSEIGVPQHEVPLALFTFNVGVETGQLLFIAVVLSLTALLKRLPLTAPQGAWRLLPYSIGGVAAFWTIDRVASFLPLPV